MTDVHMRADMEALMARLVQTESIAGHTTAIRSCAESVSTACGYKDHWQGSYVHWRTQRLARVVIPIRCVYGICKSQVDRSNAMSCDGGRKITAAAVTQQSFDEHNAQLYLALALLCKGGALVTVKNTIRPEINSNDFGGLWN